MKNNTSVKYGLGCLILDCVLLLDTANDLRTGKLTLAVIFLLITASMILVVPIAALVKRSKRKEREQSGKKAARIECNTDDVE